MLICIIVLIIAKLKKDKMYGSKMFTHLRISLGLELINFNNLIIHSHCLYFVSCLCCTRLFASRNWNWTEADEWFWYMKYKKEEMLSCLPEHSKYFYLDQLCFNDKYMDVLQKWCSFDNCANVSCSKMYKCPDSYCIPYKWKMGYAKKVQMVLAGKI